MLKAEWIYAVFWKGAQPLLAQALNEGFVLCQLQTYKAHLNECLWILNNDKCMLSLNDLRRRHDFRPHVIKLNASKLVYIPYNYIGSSFFYNKLHYMFSVEPIHSRVLTHYDFVFLENTALALRGLHWAPTVFAHPKAEKTLSVMVVERYKMAYRLTIDGVWYKFEI